MVETRTGELPDFENPPVVETVLSVQFAPLAEMRAAHIGLLWHGLRDRFPRTEERPPIDQVLERFPEPPRPRLGVQLQALENPPVPRIWFLNEGGTELMQVQQDRFIKNWRKVGVGDQYPRYEKVKAAFEADFDGFQSFVAEHKLGTIRVNQCEVTYVNHILAGEGWESYRDVDKIFTVWRQPTSDTFPGAVEDLRFYARFLIEGDGGKPIGRLHADAQPAIRTSDDRPMYVFNLTARGQIGESFEFFDAGRLWIVRSFVRLTTEDMHDIWKRRDRAGNR